MKVAPSTFWCVQVYRNDTSLACRRCNDFGSVTLCWLHNGRNSISNHQPHDCLLNLYSSADQRKHQSSASLAFVRGIHRWWVNSSHKGPAMRKMFPFDDIIMITEHLQWVNSLWPSDALRWHKFGSALAQVMACCLMAPRHNLNQCWLTSNGSWCMGIKGEMSGTVCVTFTWYMYIYMSCL